MERNAWGGPNIMVWGGIGLNMKLGPVIFQNLGPGRGNGVTAARYIDDVLRPHGVRISHVIKTRRTSRIMRVRIQPGQQEISCSRIMSML